MIIGLPNVTWFDMPRLRGSIVDDRRSNKDTRQFIAAGVFVLILVLLMLYLTFIPVPDANKDLIVTILGVLMGGAAAAMPKLFGDKADEDVAKLVAKVDKLEASNVLLHQENALLKEQLDKLREMLVERHVVNGEGFRS